MKSCFKIHQIFSQCANSALLETQIFNLTAKNPQILATLILSTNLHNRNTPAPYPTCTRTTVAHNKTHQVNQPQKLPPPSTATILKKPKTSLKRSLRSLLTTHATHQSSNAQKTRATQVPNHVTEKKNQQDISKMQNLFSQGLERLQPRPATVGAISQV